MFHSLPKECVPKQNWVKFVDKNHVNICDSIGEIHVYTAHFTDDCFDNLMHNSKGFTKKLRVNEGKGVEMLLHFQ